MIMPWVDKGKEGRHILFLGQVGKEVEGKMNSRPIKKGNICREMEEKGT
jgi:hypothetical protein